MNTITYGHALYYPYINIPDKWIKTAALFYEGISRIVPQDDGVTMNTRTVQALIDEHEFVRDIDPIDSIDEIANDFLQFAREQLATADGRGKYFKSLGAVIPKGASFSIHTYKMAEALREELPRLGLATGNTSAKDRNWFEFDPMTGAIYMSFLANSVAATYQLPIVADDPVFQCLTRGTPTETHPNLGKRDVAHALASIVISAQVPEDVSSIPVKKILAFRKKYNDERHLFYRELNVLTKDIEAVENQQALRDCLESKKRHIDIAVKNLELSFKSIGIATVTALLGLSIPPFVSGLAPGLVSAGVVTVAGGKALGQGIEYRRNKQSSPYSYVLSLKKRLRAETFAEQLFKGKIIF